MKALLDIKRPIWAKIKYLATIENVTISCTVEKLLTEALSNGMKQEETNKFGQV
jgi:hypothetical protein